MEALLGKLADWLFGWFTGARTRKRKIKGRLLLIRAEINQAIDRAREYKKSPYKSPAYRGVTESYDAVFVSLAEEGAFDSNGVATIKGAYADIVDFSRCLQQIHDVVGSQAKRDEVGRAMLKADNVLKSAPEALAVVDAKLNG